MQEILPGIYLVNLTMSGFDSGSINVYLIRTHNGFTAIDTGWDTPPSVESLQQQLAELGARMTEITEVIITHAHIDHLGLLPRFKHSHSPKVYLHEKEINLLRIRFANGDSFLPLTDGFLRSHGVPASELTLPDFVLPQSDELVSTQPDVLLHGGDTISAGPYTLQVIDTPGHTPGHIALYEPDKKFLLSGDMLLPTIATNAAFHVQHIPFPLQLYLSSLMTLRKLDIDLVLPGHEYVFNNPHQRIDELFKRHEKKSGEIFKAFTDGEVKTAYEVSRGLARSKKTGIDAWPQMDGWVKRFAVLQTIAYLESLRFNKKLEMETRDGIQIYHIV